MSKPSLISSLKKIRSSFFYYRNIYRIQKCYSSSNESAKNDSKVVIVMIDGKVSHGGLADRLRGIASVYIVCKKMGLDFKLHFVNPFPISEIYDTNKVDWKISPSDISYNKYSSKAYYLMNDNKYYYGESGEKAFIDILNSDYKQLHIYTNSLLSLDCGKFQESYHELFTLTESFNNELKQHTNILGDDFICVGARFAGSLGDFRDACSDLLSPEEQIKLMCDCKSKIQNIHNEHPSQKILLATDSERFIDYLKDEEYIYTIDGARTHIDNDKYRQPGFVISDDEYEKIKTTCLDYILISRSSNIFQIQGPGMWQGGFTLSASKINNRPYTIIKF